MNKAEKKPRGRPVKKGYPPRIDAMPEELARIVLNGGRPKAWVKSRTYRCAQRTILSSISCASELAWTISCHSEPGSASTGSVSVPN